MDGIGTVAAIGGILLALVLVYAVIAQRNRSRKAVAHTETATRDLYAKVDAEDKASDPDTKNF